MMAHTVSFIAIPIFCGKMSYLIARKWEFKKSKNHVDLGMDSLVVMKTSVDRWMLTNTDSSTELLVMCMTTSKLILF